MASFRWDITAGASLFFPRPLPGLFQLHSPCKLKEKPVLSPLQPPASLLSQIWWENIPALLYFLFPLHCLVSHSHACPPTPPQFISENPWVRRLCKHHSPATSLGCLQIAGGGRVTPALWAAGPGTWLVRWWVEKGVGPLGSSCASDQIVSLCFILGINEKPTMPRTHIFTAGLL